MPERRCDECGAEYRFPASKSKTSRFCSKPCQFAWRKHWRRSPEERFWERARPGGNPDQCWSWDGFLMAGGYPGIWEGSGSDRKIHTGHRLSWQLHHGPIPDGFWVCHRCDNPSCTNPRHLFLGTPSDNAIDMVVKGRAFKPKLSPDDVIAIRKDSRHPETLAHLYDVDESTIRCVKRLSTWKFVA